MNTRRNCARGELLLRHSCSIPFARRAVGDRLPKIVYPVDASRRFNIRINGCDLRRGFIFLDERGQCSVSQAVEKLEYNLAKFTKPDNLARAFHRPP
jgi:hypothetical protein